MKNLLTINRILSWLSPFALFVFAWRALDLYDQPGREPEGLFYNWKFNALMALAGFALMMIVWYLNWRKNPEKHF